MPCKAGADVAADCETGTGMKPEPEIRIDVALDERLPYQLRLSPPVSNCLWAGLSLDRQLNATVPAVKSLHVPLRASLGIAILKVSPNLTGFRLVVSN